MATKTNLNKSTLKERVLLLEHSIHGNGSIGIVEQIHQLENEVKSIKRLLYVLIISILLLIGEQGISLIKKLL